MRKSHNPYGWADILLVWFAFLTDCGLLAKHFLDSDVARENARNEIRQNNAEDVQNHRLGRSRDKRARIQATSKEDSERAEFVVGLIWRSGLAGMMISALWMGLKRASRGKKSIQAD